MPPLVQPLYYDENGNPIYEDAANAPVPPPPAVDPNQPSGVLVGEAAATPPAGGVLVGEEAVPPPAASPVSETAMANPQGTTYGAPAQPTYNALGGATQYLAPTPAPASLPVASPVSETTMANPPGTTYTDPGSASMYYGGLRSAGTANSYPPGLTRQETIYPAAGVPPTPMAISDAERAAGEFNGTERQPSYNVLGGATQYLTPAQTGGLGGVTPGIPVGRDRSKRGPTGQRGYFPGPDPIPPYVDRSISGATNVPPPSLEGVNTLINDPNSPLPQGVKDFMHLFQDNNGEQGAFTAPIESNLYPAVARGADIGDWILEGVRSHRPAASDEAAKTLAGVALQSVLVPAGNLAESARLAGRAGQWLADQVDPEEPWFPVGADDIARVAAGPQTAGDVKEVADYTPSWNDYVWGMGNKSQVARNAVDTTQDVLDTPLPGNAPLAMQAGNWSGAKAQEWWGGGRPTPTAGDVEAQGGIATEAVRDQFGVPTDDELEAMSLDALRVVMSDERTPAPVKQKVSVVLGRKAAQQAGMLEGPLIPPPDLEGIANRAAWNIRSAANQARGAPDQPAYIPEAGAMMSRAPTSLPTPPPPTSPQQERGAPPSEPIPSPPVSPQPNRPFVLPRREPSEQPLDRQGAPVVASNQPTAIPRLAEPTWQDRLAEAVPDLPAVNLPQFTLNPPQGVPTPTLPQWDLTPPQGLPTFDVPGVTLPTNLDDLPRIQGGLPFDTSGITQGAGDILNRLRGAWGGGVPALGQGQQPGGGGVKPTVANTDYGTYGDQMRAGYGTPAIATPGGQATTQPGESVIVKRLSGNPDVSIVGDANGDPVVANIPGKGRVDIPAGLLNADASTPEEIAANNQALLDWVAEQKGAGGEAVTEPAGATPSGGEQPRITPAAAPGVSGGSTPTGRTLESAGGSDTPSQSSQSGDWYPPRGGGYSSRGGGGYSSRGGGGGYSGGGGFGGFGPNFPFDTVPRPGSGRDSPIRQQILGMLAEMMAGMGQAGGMQMGQMGKKKKGKKGEDEEPFLLKSQRGSPYYQPGIRR